MNELGDKITYTTTEFSDEQRMLKYGETPLKKNLLQQITFDNEGVSLSMRSGKSYTFRKGQYSADESLLVKFSQADHGIVIQSNKAPYEKVRIYGYEGELPTGAWEDIKNRLGVNSTSASKLGQESNSEGTKEEGGIFSTIIGDIIAALVLALFIGLITEGEVGYWGRVGVTFAILTALIVYFIPSIIAFHYKHQYRWPIFIVNLLLGTTLIGWIASFIACFFFREPQKTTVEVVVRKGSGNS